jgi:hypothetical protein
MKIKVFISDGGVNIIDAWLAGLPIGARAKMDRYFAYLATLKFWGPPDCKKLKGYDHIFEIRIKWNKIQYRPLGCYGPEGGDFTLLIGAIEKSTGVFEPRRAPEIAQERCKLIHSNRRYVDEYF